MIENKNILITGGNSGIGFFSVINLLKTKNNLYILIKSESRKNEFLKIIENTKNRRFQVNAEMMNLLGCSKENFYKLMNYMDYKKDKAIDTYIFKGERKQKKKIIRFDKKENPFNKLLSLNIK